MDLKGSNTEKNLYMTFAGESRARNKYNLYAEQARSEGYRWIADVFDETADNERAHAREVFKRYLKNIGNTEENLLAAASGEASEFQHLYKQFEKVAREEGFIQIADFYKELREVEEYHFNRYTMIAEKLKNDRIFKSDKEMKWQCMNCGYIYEGEEVPEHCPLCKYPRSYFKPMCKVE